MLPILVSVPHGGTETPPEIADRVRITPKALFDDSDAFTREIFDARDQAARFHAADIARAFVDLNRAPDDRPPANPDGVVKTATCYNEPIYAPGQELDDGLTELLLERYFHPYHTRLREAMADERVRLALDCHSMAAEAPPVSPDAGSRRPLFCLSNDNGRTCPAELMERLAEALARAFEVERSEIRLNDPFKGGYITQSLGGGRLPWVQVEMNRSLYLVAPWFDRDGLTVEPARLAELRDRFLHALRSLGL